MAKGCAIFNSADAVAYIGSVSSATVSCGGWFFMANRIADTDQHFFYLNADADIGLRMNTANALKVSGFPETLSATPATGASEAVVNGRYRQ